VAQGRLARDVYHLAKAPLPFRKLNYTVPGHSKCTLYEADDLIEAELRRAGWAVEKEAVQVQAFRHDASRPRAHQYSSPQPEDPWYTAYNVWGRRRGSRQPDEVIILCAHKDSQSWVDSPGAYDNAVGTAADLEIARVLADYEPHRSVWFLFCNEEHTPWTSVAAAEQCKRRGDNVVAVLNQDGLGGKSREDAEAGGKPLVTAYTLEDGRRLAELMGEVNAAYGIGLTHSVVKRGFANDDDGSFVKAGYGAAIVNIGSFPYADPNYHIESDTPENVDMENLHMSVQAVLAALLRLDRDGPPAP
jgi:Zn-dependent M28 family amino/carboxypeptidase